MQQMNEYSKKGLGNSALMESLIIKNYQENLKNLKRPTKILFL